METGIKMPGEALFIIHILNNNGFEAYAVGGCVRDSILGKKPEDWDIATNAKPGEVKNLFNKTIDTGLKHGTVTVVPGGQNEASSARQSFEVTTYRIDGKYIDNRRPETVVFTSSLEYDLSRRDFTINAIACHPEQGLVDPFGGIKDIESRIIRTVGDAGERFREDALRMLRAVRFSAQLDFAVDSSTLQSIKNNCLLIQNISLERVRDELTKIIISDQPVKFSLLKDTGLLQFILPEFEACFETAQNHPYHLYNVAVHSLNSLSYVEKDKTLRWAMLLHDIGKSSTKTTDDEGVDHFYSHHIQSVQLAEEILKKLRFDSKTIDKVLRLIKYHSRSIEMDSKAVRKAVYTIGDDIFSGLLKVKEADYKAQNPEYLKDRLDKLDGVKAIYMDIKEKQPCFSLKDLAINGQDLINMGFRQGREIGEILNRLLDMMIENPELNKKEKLIELARNMYSSGKSEE